MTYVSRLLRSGVHRVLMWQAVIVLVVACGVFLIHRERFDVFSALYGGAVAMMMTFLLGFRLQRAAAMNTAKSGLGDLRLYLYLYVGALERFGLVALFLGVGVGYFHLRPFLVIVGFTAVHMGYLFKLPTRPALRNKSQE